jgi:lipid II:glycine glycyltransferase (peptidoglycan interpeptide bridge formation enzyme)
VRWAGLTADDVDAHWDVQLLNFADQNLYQSSRWGRYKSARGWHPQYFRATSDGSVIGMVQALVRKYPLGAVVAWCPGGPVGALEACSRESMGRLASALGARFLYCRATLLRSRTAADERYLRANGWVRPARTVSASMTAVWDLRRTDAELLAGLNRNWRYSLRQAQKSALNVEQLVDPPIEELTDLCRAMNASKGVPAAIQRSDVAGMFDALGDRVLVYGCRNSSGQLIAFHSCALQGPHAWELLAATSQEGRRTGASFAVLWELMRHCRRLDVAHYDLAGIDPVKAPGVADFKRWTGAREVEWLGEWEWSTLPLLRHVIDLTVRHRSEAALP